MEKVVLPLPSGEVSVSGDVARVQLHFRLFDHEFNERGRMGMLGIPQLKGWKSRSISVVA